MPLYTYTCRDHGEFAAWGKMESSDSPQPCPSCHEPSGRALARPMIGKAEGGGESMMAGGCGEGMCGTGPGMGMGGGGCCGGGACVH